MRVGRPAATVRAIGLDNAAGVSAVAIRAAGDPGEAIPRFLVRLADHLQGGAAGKGGCGRSAGRVTNPPISIPEV